MQKTLTENNTKSMISSETKYIFQAVSDHTFTSRLHSHTFYEFISVISGICTHVSNDSTFELKAKDFVLLCPGDKHQLLQQNETASILCISISRDEFQKYKILFGDTLVAKHSVPVALTVCISDILKELVADTSNPTQNEIRAVCSSLFANYCDAIGENHTTCQRLIYMTEELLKNTEQLQRGLRAMVELSGYSEAQLGRLTKKHYHTSPHEYLKRLRLQKAWQYILQTDLPLEDIGLLCGYNCYGYFTSIFKEKYGLSPAMLRKTKH